MDSYETLNSCPMSKFTSTTKYGKMTDLKSDSCIITIDDIQSQKALKYYTQNFFDRNIVQNRGINFNDGFGIPACQIDNEPRNGVITNLNIPQSLPAFPLPTTASYVRGGPPNEIAIDIENQIRPQIDNKRRNACYEENGRFYERSFYIFDGLPIKPLACVDNYVQKDCSYRQGCDTRRDNYINYRYGKKC